MAHIVDRGFIVALRFAEIVVVCQTGDAKAVGKGFPRLVIVRVSEFSFTGKVPEKAVLDSLICSFHDSSFRGRARRLM